MSYQSDIQAPVRLREALRRAADEWCTATGRSLGALSTLVSNYAGTISRLDDPGAAITDLKLEQFARWLAQPANWPEGRVEKGAEEFAHRVGISVAGTVPASGKPEQLSGGVKGGEILCSNS